MSDQPGAHARLLSPAQVGEVLSVGVAEVMTLVGDRRLRGVRVGSPAQWRIEAASLEEAIAKFPQAVQEALNQAIEEAREYRREAQSRSVVPEAGAMGGLGGGAVPGGGRIKL